MDSSLIDPKWDIPTVLVPDAKKLVASHARALMGKIKKNEAEVIEETNKFRNILIDVIREQNKYIMMLEANIMQKAEQELDVPSIDLLLGSLRDDVTSCPPMILFMEYNDKIELADFIFPVQVVVAFAPGYGMLENFRLENSVAQFKKDTAHMSPEVLQKEANKLLRRSEVVLELQNRSLISTKNLLAKIPAAATSGFYAVAVLAEKWGSNITDVARIAANTAEKMNVLDCVVFLIHPTAPKNGAMTVENVITANGVSKMINIVHLEYSKPLTKSRFNSKFGRLQILKTFRKWDGKYSLSKK